MKRTILVAVLGGGVVALLPGVAEAHLINTSCGPFYDGFCHPFVTPADLLIVLALALFAGSAGPAAGRHILFLLTVSWLVGMVIGQIWLDSSFTLPVALSAAGSLLVALLVAADLRSPRVLLGLLGVTIGVGLGLSNGAEFRSVNDGRLALAGNLTCLFVVTTWVTALAVKNDQGWRHIVIRVAGSWIAAASLLMIGWEFRNR